MTARFLIDKSALARMVHKSVRERLAPIIEAGEAATCAIVDLEVLFSARNYADHFEIRRRRQLAYERVAVDDRVLDRAIGVQSELARSGRHRVPIPDLIIAAAAEASRLIVLHYDRDFETIAEITGQAVEWVVARGSVP